MAMDLKFGEFNGSLYDKRWFQSKGVRLISDAHIEKVGSDFTSSGKVVISWHPYRAKFALCAQQNSKSTVFVTEYNPTQDCWETENLIHEFQSNISCLAWQPHSSTTLAVGCRFMLFGSFIFVILKGMEFVCGKFLLDKV
jgi:hypothetical protein